MEISKPTINKKWWILLFVVFPAVKIISKSDKHNISSDNNSLSKTFKCPICNKEIQGAAYYVAFGQIKAVDISNLNLNNYPLHILNGVECYECAQNIVNSTR